MTLLTAWKVTRPDRTTYDGFQWPARGVVSLPDGEYDTHTEACGQGLHLAKTFYGASLGGLPATTAWVVTYQPRDVLGEDEDKVRVRRCRVVKRLDVCALIRDGWFAGANLSGANLRAAKLPGANLWGANLSYAHLRGANLSAASLPAANLSYANLAAANLSAANLSGANLRGANLPGANLSYASLPGANLSGANLRDAYLPGAITSLGTRWPDGFDPSHVGVKVR